MIFKICYRSVPCVIVVVKSQVPLLAKGNKEELHGSGRMGVKLSPENVSLHYVK